MDMDMDMDIVDSLPPLLSVFGRVRVGWEAEYGTDRKGPGGGGNLVFGFDTEKKAGDFYST